MKYDEYSSTHDFSFQIMFQLKEYKKDLPQISQTKILVYERLKPNPIMAQISHRISVTFYRLNTMIIQPKYNSPFSDVVSSNAPPLHSDGSHPIRGFLFGE